MNLLEIPERPGSSGLPNHVQLAGRSAIQRRANAQIKPATSIASLALLAACGVDGEAASSGAPSSSTPPVVVMTSPPNETQASRFLGQATMGATREAIGDVVSKGFEGWLDAQIAMPRESTLWDAMIGRGQSAFANVNSIDGYDSSVWRSLILSPDQLRQRVATALLDFLVVGGPIQTIWPQMHAAAYLDILMTNAFGNYRTILDQVTHNPAMGSWLSILGSRKGDSATGSEPDENYARELMQLFSIGLYQLNMDGSLKTVNGAPVYTYSQTDVSQLARVFTGLHFPDPDWQKYTIARNALIVYADLNETGPSSFLGTTVTGGGSSAITAALDAIFAHPNVPPFVCKQLIQRLVTSNPSLAYVGRVASVFANNGRGVRGDLAAVVKSILLDSEARDDAALSSNSAGRLRAPVQRVTGWARAFKVSSESNAWAIGNTSSAATGIGQSTGQAPSVFNFFRPGYTPPGSAVAAQGLVAPEFQIENEQSVISYLNFMYKLVGQGVGDVRADYSALTAKADDTTALLDEINLLLAAGQMPATTIAIIKRAVDNAASPAAKVNIAILLTLAAPEFMVAR